MVKTKQKNMINVNFIQKYKELHLMQKGKHYYLIMNQTQGKINAAFLKQSLRQVRGDKLLQQKEDEALKKALLENQFGCMCLQGGKLDMAEKHLKIAEEQLFSILNGPITNIWMNLGNLFAQKRQHDIAIQNYKLVVTQSPYVNESLYPNEKLHFWSSRINSFEAYIDAHTNLACLLANTGDLEEAYQYCLKAVNFQKNNYEALTNLGDLLRQLGRREEALSLTWKLIEEDCQIKPEPIDCKNITSQVEKETLFLLCVKWGTKYGSDYVNKLFQGVKKNTTMNFTFLCLTDNKEGLDMGIECLDLEEGWTGWWGKATLFKLPCKGRMVYIDLDMIITGNIDEILKYNGPFGILKTDDLECEKTNKNGYNSSIMIWSSESFYPVYDVLQKNQESIRKFIVRFDFWLEMMIKNADFLQDLYPSQISDYLKECKENVPENTRIVCFPRMPKPDSYPSEWIKEKW